MWGTLGLVSSAAAGTGAYKDGVNEFLFAPEKRMSLSRADISAQAQAKSAN